MEETKSFYFTKSWQKCRESYKVSVGGWCERCKQKGILKEAEIVHHIIPITPSNMNDPTITLNWDNLMAVCRECHGEEHKSKPKRYLIDCMGNVIIPPIKRK